MVLQSPLPFTGACDHSLPATLVDLPGRTMTVTFYAAAVRRFLSLSFHDIWNRSIIKYSKPIHLDGSIDSQGLHELPNGPEPLDHDKNSL